MEVGKFWFQKIVEENKRLKKENAMLEERFYEEENKTTKLSAEAIKYQERIDDLEQCCDDLKSGDETLEKEIAELKKQIDYHKSVEDSATDLIDELWTRINEDEKQIQELKYKLEFRTRQYQGKAFNLEVLADEIDIYDAIIRENELQDKFYDDGRRSRKYVHKYTDDYLNYHFSGIEIWKKNVKKIN